MLFSDFKKFGTRLLPALTRMQPADKPNESTQVRYVDMAFDVPLKDNLFTLRSLQR